MDSRTRAGPSPSQTTFRRCEIFSIQFATQTFSIPTDVMSQDFVILLAHTKVGNVIR